MKIDSHQHYWKSHGQEEKSKRNGSRNQSYLPEHLKPVLRKAGIDKTIVVQTSPTEEETSFLLKLAEEENTIAGVVGWLDLEAEGFEEKWKRFKKYDKFKGIRPMIQDLPSNWILEEKVLKNLNFLADQKFAVDLQANPRHLKYVIKLLEKVPHLHAVIDHLAKPPIEEGKMEPWAQEMKEIANYPGIMCKLSGMVPEKENAPWTVEQIAPYAEVIIEAFGVERIMFGSDWPICLKSATPQQVLDLFESILPMSLTNQDRKAVYGENAACFYQLKLEG